MKPYVEDRDLTLYCGDAAAVMAELPDDAAHCCVTSPPYLDARPEYNGPDDWIAFFKQLRRVVRGAALINVGRLFRNGSEQLWWLRLLHAAELVDWHHLDTLVWVKPNANPLHGPLLANSHEYVLILGAAQTNVNSDAVRTPYAASSIARLKRGWTNHIAQKNRHSDRQRSSAELHEAGARPRSFIVIPTGRDKGNPHPAPMALELAEYLVSLASWPANVVLDPFAGSGTTAIAARNLGRSAILVEESEAYCRLAAERLQQLSLLAEVAT